MISSDILLIGDTLNDLRTKYYVEEAACMQLDTVFLLNVSMVMMVGEISDQKLSEQVLQNKQEVLTLFCEEFVPWMEKMERLIAWI